MSHSRKCLSSTDISRGDFESWVSEWPGKNVSVSPFECLSVPGKNVSPVPAQISTGLNEAELILTKGALA